MDGWSRAVIDRNAERQPRHEIWITPSRNVIGLAALWQVLQDELASLKPDGALCTRFAPIFLGQGSASCEVQLSLRALKSDRVTKELSRFHTEILSRDTSDFRILLHHVGLHLVHHYGLDAPISVPFLLPCIIFIRVKLH